MKKSFIFRGILVRHEDGAVRVIAETVQEAKGLLREAEWEEIHSWSGETSFKWNGQPPEEET